VTQSLSDLDRCLHGRHSIDGCLGCPNGQSTGNLFLRNGQRIGTDHGGEPIYAVTERPERPHEGGREEGR
jgi:hypothetical protein